MLATGGFSFPGSRWSVRATVLRIPAAGLSGADGVCPGRIARGFEPDPQEAVHRTEGHRRETGRGKIYLELASILVVSGS